MSKCTNCGTNLVGTPETPPVPGLCKYCEIQKLKFDKAKLWKALSELVGVNTERELKEMELALRVVPGIERDKISGSNAIHALLDTIEP